MVIVVEMGEANISKSTIISKGFGPCIFFLLDFISNGELTCYLEHFSYGFNLKDLSEMEILVLILEEISENLRNCLKMDLISSQDLNGLRLNSFQLLVPRWMKTIRKRSYKS